MTQDIELKKPYTIVIKTSDGKEISNFFDPGSTSGSSVTASTGDAGITLTPAQFNFLVNNVNNLEAFAQEQEQEGQTLTHGIEAEVNLGIFKFRFRREKATKK